VDGLIIVDLPTEEADLLLPYSNANGLDFIRLVAPTTNDARLSHVLNGSSGFVYYVSITGITGTRAATTEHLEAAIPRLRKATDLPIAIGFGVRSPEQAGNASRIADGAVVASALIDTLAANIGPDGKALPGAVEKVLDQVRELAAAVRR
jgi:tryptophan synthase alpha chain